MHTGQWMIAGASAIKVFSPWFPRGSDNAIFTYEVIATVGSPTFVVKIVEKSSEDPGSGTARTETFSAISGATSFLKIQCEGLQEMVRFQLEISGTATDAVLYRMLAPTWFNDAQ